MNELREKISTYGITSVGTIELASFICNINPDHLANINNTYDLNNMIDQLDITELQKKRLESLFMFKKLASREALATTTKITSPTDLMRFFYEEYQYDQQERILLLSMDTKFNILKYQNLSELTVGLSSSCLIDPKTVYTRAMKDNASHIAVLHNHPSGDPSPSEEDKALCKRLKDAGDLMGIPLIDFLIIGDHRHVSFKEQGML